MILWLCASRLVEERRTGQVGGTGVVGLVLLLMLLLLRLLLVVGLSVLCWGAPKCWWVDC